MARGKHGQAAAVRQEVQSRDAEIETYQRRVAQLTAENRSLRDQLRGEQQRHREVERRLRAERDAGVAPQIEALEQRLQELTLRHKRCLTKLQDLQERWQRGLLRLGDHFINEHGTGGLDTAEAVMGTIDGTEKPLLLKESRQQAEVFGDDGRAVVAMQLRRRERRTRHW